MPPPYLSPMRDLNELITASNQSFDRFDLDAAAGIADEFEALGTVEGHFRSVFSHARLAFFHGDFDRSLRLYEEARDIALTMNDAALSAKSLSGIGVLLHRKGELQRALEVHMQSLAEYEAIGLRAGIAAQYHNIGLTLESLGDLAAAIPYVRRAIELQQELNDVFRIAHATSLLGSIYNDCGQITEGIKLLFQALDQFEQIGNQHYAAQIMANIASAYHDLKRDEEALVLYERALQTFRELDVLADAGNVLASIGSTLSALGRKDEAQQRLEESIALLQQCGDTGALSWAYEKLAHLHVDNNNLDAARALIASSQPWDGLPPILQREWMLTHADVLIAENALDDAAAIAEQALEITKRSGATTHVAEVHEMLRDLALKRNDFPGYVHHNNEYQRLTEEIRGNEVTQQLTILEAERAFDRERQEHEKQRAILYSTLPKHIADRMSRGEQVNDHYDHAAVIFLDIVGFTSLSSQLSSTDVVAFLDHVFSALDAVCKQHDVVKIKTIGDSYMAVAFPTSVPHSVRNDSSTLPSSSEEDVIPNEVRNLAERAAHAALDMLDAISQILPDLPEGLRADLPEGIRVRLGVHIGALTAGVVGTERLQYDVWGDTVNLASRLESTGEPGKIHVSEEFASSLGLRPRNDNSPLANGNESVGEISSTWHVAQRGKIEIKGKGPMSTYWLQR